MIQHAQKGSFSLVCLVDRVCILLELALRSRSTWADSRLPQFHEAVLAPRCREVLVRVVGDPNHVAVRLCRGEGERKAAIMLSPQEVGRGETASCGGRLELPDVVGRGGWRKRGYARQQRGMRLGWKRVYCPRTAAQGLG